MKANTYELNLILGLQRRYVIPTFQRDYEWTKDGQWKLLFEDLEAVVERLEKARNDATANGQPVAKAEKVVSPHFLGAVVLDQLPSAAGHIDLRAVIDGQQRLTTVHLLLRGVLDVLLERGSRRAPQVRRLIENPADVITTDDDKYKLWPRRRDREVWQACMADAEPAQIDHLYVTARRFFRDEFSKAVAAAGADRSETFVDALLSLVKIVVIDLEDNDDAQVIFEVLNGRQTPLSATDLVKNLLFLRAEFTDETQLDGLYTKHWAPFDDPWWKQEIGRGHAARGRRDVLLSTWLTAASGSEISVSHLYGEARNYLDERQPRIEDVLGELSHFARAFRELSEPAATVPERIADAYRRLDQLSVTTALPLLVWLRTLPETILSPKDHERAVVATESWVIRRMIVGANTRGYGKRFVDVLKAGKTALNNGANVADAIIHGLLQATDNLKWSTNADVENAFLTRPFYDNVSQERIRLVLAALDRQLHTEHKLGEKPQFNYNALQIEHVMPQAWSDHWPIEAVDDSTRQLKRQERDRIKNRLGNLTLVNGSLNPSMSNGSWATKREALRVHSNLRLNTEVVACESWDEATIEHRGRRLAAVACRIWPRPDTA